MITTDKTGISKFIDLLIENGVNRVVCSPGSRNAPFLIAFDEHPNIDTIVIHDERSAAFYALGMALELNEPVAVVCTSGSAMLNYYPAVAEAFYQCIPLVVISADRPEEWINNGDGQTIVQKGVYDNHIRAEKTIPEFVKNQSEVEALEVEVNEAFFLGNGNWKGPIHFNCPLSEPLYNTVTVEERDVILKESERLEDEFSLNELEMIRSGLISSEKTMILVGQMKSNTKLLNLLSLIADDGEIAVLVENTSNLSYSKFVGGIDQTLSLLSEDEMTVFSPDLLISLGGAIISKRIKHFLRNSELKNHWKIGYDFPEMDTYESLSHTFLSTPEQFMEELFKVEKSQSDNLFGSKWIKKNYLAGLHSEKYLKNTPFSDLKVFETILDFIPPNSNLHMSNSSVVRYCQLFASDKTISYYANRGTSGIDGSTSTACGVALICPEKINVLITGDISFFYDSNALWNDYLSPNLRIILINNGGGGIFRFIDGPNKTQQLESHFEAKHNFKAEFICKAFDLNYKSIDNLTKLEEEMEMFYAPSNRPKLIEIFTPYQVNDKVLKDLFRAIKK